MAPQASDSPASDLADLLTRVARQDESALAAFYDRTQPWVFGLCHRILHDRHLAEEVSLDVYLQVWRTAVGYEPTRGTPATWLMTLARSRAIDRLRALGARRSHEEPFHEGFDAIDRSLGPEAKTRKTEAHRRVLGAVSRLPREQARAIELAFFQGLTHHEVAERLEEPVGTVKTRIRLGMIKLRGLLKPFEDET